MDSLPVGYCSSLIWTGCIIELSNVLVASSMRYEIIFLPVYSCFSSGTSHLLSATVRVYSLVAPCRLPDLTSLALLGSASGQPRLSRSPCLATRGFQNGGCSFKIQPPSPYFHKDLARLFTPQHLWAVISCLLSC